MFAWFSGLKLKLIAAGAIVLATVVGIASIFRRGETAGESKVAADAARVQAKAVETAREVHEDAAARPASDIGKALNDKYGRQ